MYHFPCVGNTWNGLRYDWLWKIRQIINDILYSMGLPLVYELRTYTIVNDHEESFS